MQLLDKNFYCFCLTETALSLCLIILQKKKKSSEIIIHADIYIFSPCLKIASSQKGTEGI